MEIPSAWPAASLAEIETRLCAPGARFEMEAVSIRGVTMRTWKHLHATLPDLVRHARGHGSRTFLVYREERVSYEGWFRAVALLARHMRSLGIAKGDRVALAMRNLPEWPVVYFAATVIGAVVVPLNAWWSADELAYGLADSGAKLLVADDERWRRIGPDRSDLPDLEQVVVARAGAGVPAALESVIGTPANYKDLPDVDVPDVALGADDRATIFYTSGTTGAPKGALGTHRSTLTNIFSSAYGAARAALRRGEEPPAPTPKIFLTVVPMFHVTACNATMMGAMQAGSTMIFMHKWDALEAMRIIEREKVTHTGGVPTIAWQLLEHPRRREFDLSSLEAISYGGAPSAPELVRKIFAEFGALPGNGWGMTETCATVTSHSGEDYLNRPTSCGPPVPVAELRIMDETGTRELPVGRVGELWAKGPQVVEGYWNKPEATAETFVNGWVRTGDLARLDEEGFCYIVDRAKDIVIRGGENIYSCEVEDALYAHPAVTDAAIIGIPHRTLGEEPVAVVHLAPATSATEDELKEWVRARLAPFKVPVEIRFSADMLPRNANGKILKRDLKQLFAA